jgi:hypothetical protein
MKDADAFSRNHLNLEIKTYLNGTLTSHIVIDPRPSETESGLQALAHFIAYFRVSTDRQGKSGLGLAVQREAVMSYLDGGRWALVDEFTEVESGKRNDRPELEKALSACKRQKAKLRPCLWVLPRRLRRLRRQARWRVLHAAVGGAGAGRNVGAL